MMRYIAVRRDDRFSPNSVEKDRAILQAVCDELCQRLSLEQIPMVDETDLIGQEADGYISMARSAEAQEWLAAEARRGATVVNSAEGVRRCQRSVLDGLMRQAHVAMPPVSGDYGYWLKRGDAAAQSKADVVFCNDEEELHAAEDSFRQRGITDYVVSAHVVGDLVKFYGVGHRMFRYFYPSDDGISKFGDEARNGVAHHYAFPENDFRHEVERLADLVGVAVYGGDAIIDAAGRFYIIDFNDWPSFSRCREEAAKAIAQEFLATSSR